MQITTNKSRNVVRPTSNVGKSVGFKETKELKMALAFGKIFVPTIDFIFTSIFLAVGIMVFAFDKERGCE